MESESDKVHLILEEREKLYNPIKIISSKRRENCGTVEEFTSWLMDSIRCFLVFSPLFGCVNAANK